MAKKKELTVEERLKKEREQGLNLIDNEIKNINPPTYRFDIGDKVIYGHLKEAIVKEILYDGKIYGLYCIATDNNYGNPYDYETYMIVPWTDIRPIGIGDTDFVQNQDIRIIYYNKTIDMLLRKYYHFGVNMNPEYQRDYIWEQSDKELLIDSIFNNIDIGKLVFVHYDDCMWSEIGKGYEILDGKQRLNTIVEFYENRFPYKGKYYNQLSKKDRGFFEDYPIAEGEIKNADKITVLKCFLLLNRTGKRMSHEQLDKVESMLEELE